MRGKHKAAPLCWSESLAMTKLKAGGNARHRFNSQSIAKGILSRCAGTNIMTSTNPSPALTMLMSIVADSRPAPLSLMEVPDWHGGLLDRKSRARYGEFQRFGPCLSRDIRP